MDAEPSRRLNSVPWQRISQQHRYRYAHRDKQLGVARFSSMLFSSFIFICVFLPVVLCIYYLSPKSRYNAVLVVASLVFYAWGDPVAALLLIIPSVIANFFLGKLIGNASGRHRYYAIFFAVALNLSVLIIFKYLVFLVENINIVLANYGTPPISQPQITLPLGISFFTFHLLSYLVDIYRGLFPPQRSFTAFVLYIINFPQLIAGPIIRYRQMVDQLGARHVTLVDLQYGTLRFVTGLGKKALIADPIGEIANTIFGVAPTDLTSGAAWLGVVCYALQIYFDFSGYSDMAIGLARMFGFRFPENFNYPYSATSIQDFWRRWHMTLSAWFRDYLYVPLGGNRVGPWITVRNLWIVFFLTGAWHGASWNFIIWGLWHGAFLSIERLEAMKRLMERLPQPIRIAYVLLVVLLGWVFFRTITLDLGFAFLRRMFAFNADPVTPPMTVFTAVAPGTLAMLALTFGMALPIWPKLRAAFVSTGFEERHAVVYNLACAGYVAIVLILSLGALASQQYSPFLYFRF